MSRLKAYCGKGEKPVKTLLIPLLFLVPLPVSAHSQSIFERQIVDTIHIHCEQSIRMNTNYNTSFDDPSYQRFSEMMKKMNANDAQVDHFIRHLKVMFTNPALRSGKEMTWKVQLWVGGSTFVEMVQAGPGTQQSKPLRQEIQRQRS